MDWAEVRSWIGTVGGLSGFATLIWTRIDRSRDARRAELARLKVDGKRVGASSATLTFKYDPVERHEGFLAHLIVLAPKGAQAAASTVTPLVTVGAEQEFTLHMGPRPDGDFGAVAEADLLRDHSNPPMLSASFFVGPLAADASVHVKVVVTSKARQKRLNSKVMRITPAV